MKTVIRNFRTDESGAVTVDWVALTAVAIAVLMLVFGILSDGSMDLADNLQTFMNDWSF